jgi:hypothetical protein
MPDPWSDPHFAVLVNARTRLAMKCMELPIRLPIEPLTDHIGAMRDQLVQDAKYMDEVIRAYGDYLNAHVSLDVDLRQFDQEVTGALEGNALYEFDCAIEDMREQAAEVA